MSAVYRRELRAYFTGMTAYVFIAFLLLFAGIYTMAYNLSNAYPNFEYVLQSMSIIFLIAIPILTMRVIAEERRQKTDQLLYALPIGMTRVVLGKYLAMISVVAIPNLICCLFPLLIKMKGTACLKTDYISIGVFFLLGCVYVAIGMFMSALTESQMIAFITTFGLLLVLYLWNGIIGFLPSSAIGSLIGLIIILTIIVAYVYHMTENWMLSAVLEVIGIVASVVTYIVKSSLFENLLTKILGKLALADVFTDITNNHIVDITGIVLYLSVIAIFIVLTIQAIQKRRWS